MIADNEYFDYLFQNAAKALAKDMDIRTATVLVRALFEEYYNDCTMAVTINHEDRVICKA